MKGISASTLFIAFLFCVGCSDNDPACIPSSFISGQTLNTIRFPVNENTSGIAYELNGNQFSLCEGVGSTGADFASATIRLDSAFLNDCESCLAVYRWTEKGCDPVYTVRDEESSLVETTWNIAQIQIENEIFYAPCQETVTSLFQNDQVSFQIINNIWSDYLREGSLLYVDPNPATTLIGQNGYMGEFEILFLRTFFVEEPWLISIENNVLTLTNAGNRMVMFAS